MLFLWFKHRNKTIKDIMKRFFITLAALVLAAGLASAQDLESVTAIYNSGAEAYAMGDKAQAVEYFKKALDQAEGLGEAGKEVVDNCQNSIPGLVLSIAKDMIREKKYAEAIPQLNEAISFAEKFGNQDVIDEANEYMPKAMIQYGKGLAAAKKYDEAIATFQQVLDKNAEDGTAALYMGQALAASGKTEEAVEAYKVASANGQKAVANKQIATILLKKAAAQLKAKELEGAIATAIESNEYNESATAYKIAGTAATSLAKKDEAITYLSKYLELSPKAADAEQINAAIDALKKQQ